MKRISAGTRGAVLMLALAGVAAGAAHAQNYPTKPVRMIIALAPGGGVDTTGRFIAQKLHEAWGQSVVADNRPGAGGTIAAELVATAPPDGHTLLMTSAGISITPSLMKLSYDPRRDLLPVTQAVVSPGVLVVHPSLPVKSVKELIAFAKARPPGELFFSSSGLGSAQHLTLELFSQMTGLKMTHVPYKGTSPSVNDVIAGRIALTVASVISTRPFFTTGRLRALAVVGPKRTPALPDYPTIAESGVPGFGVENWYALFLPGKTDKAIAVKLQQAVTKIMTDPATEKLLLGQGLDAIGNSQEEFAKLYANEIDTWAKVVKSVGMSPK
ncbi:MAG: tripartite tricarboxylate transporter substrate binding protein [Betaproteobacteria bacterium]|jgi:tripartite-type tricarboxylate transporter receptor subunit TctC|nr:tripartite tricarboxylate transporter substrate binding protein [Betaproteobacteria bacterium]